MQHTLSGRDGAAAAAAAARGEALAATIGPPMTRDCARKLRRVTEGVCINLSLPGAPPLFKAKLGCPRAGESGLIHERGGDGFVPGSEAQTKKKAGTKPSPPRFLGLLESALCARGAAQPCRGRQIRQSRFRIGIITVAFARSASSTPLKRALSENNPGFNDPGNPPTRSH